MKSLSLLSLLLSVLSLVAQPAAKLNTAPEQLYRAGNYKEAYEIYAKRLRDPAYTGWKAGEDFQNAVQCLEHLNRISEYDTLRKEALALRPKDWEFAARMATIFPVNVGFIVDGAFIRGHHRGSGARYIDVTEQDRITAIRDLVARPAPTKGQYVADYYKVLYGQLTGSIALWNFWKLQILTDLTHSPDYTADNDRNGFDSPGIPVDEHGNPVFFSTPASWADAKNDGERARWALAKLAEARQPEEALELRAYLAQELFSVSLQEVDNEGIVKLVRNLSDKETLASLATGKQRITLPDDENPIVLWKKLAESSDVNRKEGALWRLHTIYSGRLQYDRALDCLNTLLKDLGNYVHIRERAERAIKTITGNWCTFDENSTQPAGTAATAKIIFRNAVNASFQAQKINLDLIVQETLDFIASSPEQPDWRKMSFLNLNERLSDPKTSARYVGETVARWDIALKPADGHLDTIATITTPIKEAGAYLLTCTVPGGNTCRTILVLQQLRLVTRPLLAGGGIWQLLDEVTGNPVPNTSMDVLAYDQVYDNTTRKNKFLIKRFSKTTDANGCIALSADEFTAKQLKRPHNLDIVLVSARTADGRVLYNEWPIWSFMNWSREKSQRLQPKCFIITDRPVYRPGQTVHIKLWKAYAGYGKAFQTQHTPPTATSVTIVDPRGNKILDKSIKLDEYGGGDLTLSLPANTQLGTYRISDQFGYGAFQVEEYRKPEYSVSVAVPEKSVMLGEKIPVKVSAQYYFGAPVSEGTVSLEIRRNRLGAAWHPIARWDWLYGPGYWWNTPDYPWYRGWNRWGCSADWLFRSGDFGYEMPEVVLNTRGELSADGTFTVMLDTAMAKELYGDHDQKYTVTAQVRDQSRRTIAGSGSIIAAVRPFKVYTWLDRGYLQVGDSATVTASARTADGRPVAGKAILTLYRIHYKSNGEPEEAPIQSWPITMPADGMLTQKISGSQAGQYRLGCTLTDDAGHTEEGGVIFSIIGLGSDGRDFRYNGLELIPDKAEYTPGDIARVLVNTAQEDSTVMLFIRPENGRVTYPKILGIKGKSTVVELPLSEEDKPNVFLEAYTLAKGELHTAMLELRIPPQKNTLNITMKTDKDTYKPGENGHLNLHVADETGAPVKATLAVTVYDKSLEAIAAVNRPNIRDFFWKWLRNHFIRNNAARQWGCNLMPFPKHHAMELLSGIFGLFIPMGQPEALFLQLRSHRTYSRTGAVRWKWDTPIKPGMDNRMPSAAPPAPMAAKAAPAGSMMDMADAVAVEEAETPGSENGGSSEAVMLRTNFADSAVWIARTDTDDNGNAVIDLPMPENLTSWKIQAWAMGSNTRTGQASTEVITSKDFLLRLQAPRFFVEKDLVVLSANIHNYRTEERKAQATLELDGGCLEFVDAHQRTVTIPAKGEMRIDWTVKAVKDGTAVIRMKATAGDDADAVQQSFPVLVHGADKSETASMAMSPETITSSLAFTVPEQRRIDSTKLEIHWSPSLAVAMVDALPYLIAYPYGCTEQTLNRFLPAAQVRQMLTSLGISLKDVANATANLNSQEHGIPAERRQQWKRYKEAAVFSDAELDAVIATGVRDLENMQCGDGGWGWFSGFGEYSTPHNTALVSQGLLLASRRCNVSVKKHVLTRGLQWLKNYQASELAKLRNAEKKTSPWKAHADNMDAMLFRVLSEACALKAFQPFKELDDMETFLMRDKTKLSPAGLALLGLGLHYRGHDDARGQVIRNLMQFVQEDKENQTAWLQLPGYWWMWYGDEIETHAAFLKLMAETDPKNPLGPALVKYLLNNRKNATYWRSTRDTAACLDAFATYAVNSGEIAPDMTVTVKLDGKPVAVSKINAQTMFTADLSCILTGKEISGGRHVVSFEKQGKGPLYVTSDIRYFSLEDHITAAGLEVQVHRTVSRLVRDDRQQHAAGTRGQVLDKRTEHYRREVLKDGDAVASGDLLEIELVLDSKNDYEYLLLEDWKAAGTEPVETRSGYNGNALNAYVEYRDTKTAFFIRHLARGRSSVTYRLRAETPGTFSALPAQLQAMYAPELHGNSNELKFIISD